MRIFFSTHHSRPEAIIAPFMRGVVARLTENDTIIDRIRAHGLYVPRMMSLRALTVGVLLPPFIAEGGDAHSTARAPVLLSRQSLPLRGPREFVRPRHIAPLSIMESQSSAMAAVHAASADTLGPFPHMLPRTGYTDLSFMDIPTKAAAICHSPHRQSRISYYRRIAYLKLLCGAAAIDCKRTPAIQITTAVIHGFGVY